MLFKSPLRSLLGCSGSAARIGRGAHAKDLYDIGETPPLGEVPARMHAQVVRPERFGEPKDAFRDEVIDVPELGRARRSSS